jgi:hypothetical protein
MLRVIIPSDAYAECYVFYIYAEFRYAECRYIECRNATLGAWTKTLCAANIDTAAK